MRDEKPTALLIVLLLALVIGGIADLALDAPTSLLDAHAIFELLLIGSGIGLVGYLLRSWHAAERDLVRARVSLASADAERDAWQRSARAALQGLGEAIDRQFEDWGLTPTEREVALSLLKGRALKEIAHDTGRSERTVRQHAVSVYGKSGLAGRAELAGFFLDQLSLPPTSAARR